MNGTEALLNRFLTEYEWSVRTSCCFRNEGMVTIRDLVRYTEKAILRVPNFGRKSLEEVKYFLVERGLRLGMDVPKGRIGRLKGLGAATPRCIAKVRVSTVQTHTRRAREATQLRRGLPIDQCGDYAAWTIDGDPYCFAHAGRRALQILEDQDGR